MGLRNFIGKIGRTLGFGAALAATTACEKGETKAPESDHFVEPVKERPEIAEAVRGTVDAALKPQLAPNLLKAEPIPVQPEKASAPIQVPQSAPIQVPQVVKSTPKVWQKPKTVQPVSRQTVNIPTGIDSNGDLIFDALDDIEEITDFEEIATNPPPVPKVKVAVKSRVTPPPLPKKPTVTSDNSPKTPTTQINSPAVPSNSIQAPLVTVADINSQTIPGTDGWDDILVEPNPQTSIPAVNQAGGEITDQWKTNAVVDNSELDSLFDQPSQPVIVPKDTKTEDEIIIIDDDSEKNISNTDSTLIGQTKQEAQNSGQITDDELDSLFVQPGVVPTYNKPVEANASKVEKDVEDAKHIREIIFGLVVAGVIIAARRGGRKLDAEMREREMEQEAIERERKREQEIKAELDGMISELYEESQKQKPQREKEIIAGRIALQQNDTQTSENEVQEKKPEKPPTIRIDLTRSTEGLRRLAQDSGVYKRQEELMDEATKRSKDAAARLSKSGSVEKITIKGGSGIHFIPNNITVPSGPPSTPMEEKVKVSRIIHEEAKEAVNDDIAVAK